MSVTVSIPPASLSWTNYVNGPPAGITSPFDATTTPSYNLATSPPINIGGYFRFNNVSITMSLDSPNCWVRPSKRTPALLQHERGHWILQILVAHEMEQLLLGLAEWTPTDLQREGRFTFDSQRSARVSYLNRWYDKATNHGLDKTQQAVWDAKLLKWLASRQILEEGPMIPVP